MTQRETYWSAKRRDLKAQLAKIPPTPKGWRYGPDPKRLVLETEIYICTVLDRAARRP